MSEKQKVYIGVDVGKAGAIVALYDNVNYSAYPIPLINREYDIPAIIGLFNEWTKEFDVHIVLEQVHAIFGSSAGATFEFGRGFGILETAIASHQLPYTLVQPKVWQKLCFQGIPEIRKPASEKQRAANRQGKIDTKAMALLAIKRLFPTMKLTFGKGTKPHDGLIDAALMAYFCKQTFK